MQAPYILLVLFYGISPCSAWQPRFRRSREDQERDGGWEGGRNILTTEPGKSQNGRSGWLSMWVHPRDWSRPIFAVRSNRTEHESDMEGRPKSTEMTCEGLPSPRWLQLKDLNLHTRDVIVKMTYFSDNPWSPCHWNRKLLWPAFCMIRQHPFWFRGISKSTPMWYQRQRPHQMDRKMKGESAVFYWDTDDDRSGKECSTTTLLHSQK